MIIQGLTKQNEHQLRTALWLLGGATVLVLLLFGRTLASTAPLTKTESGNGKLLAQMRWLGPVSFTQSSLISLSRVILPGHAIGQLVFINDGPTDITLQSTILRSKNGIEIAFTGPITVPALDPTIIATGFAVIAGDPGNIPLFALVQACCGANIVVKNATAFIREQQVPPNDLLTQNDIDTAAQPLNAALMQEVLTTLNGQVRSNAHVVNGSVQCHQAIMANHHVGDVAQTVTITVTVTCNEEVSNKN